MRKKINGKLRQNIRIAKLCDWLTVCNDVEPLLCPCVDINNIAYCSMWSVRIQISLFDRFSIIRRGHESLDVAG